MLKNFGIASFEANSGENRQKCIYMNFDQIMYFVFTHMSILYYIIVDLRGTAS